MKKYKEYNLESLSEKFILINFICWTYMLKGIVLLNSKATNARDAWNNYCFSGI
jgi:hypothetical protein